MSTNSNDVSIPTISGTIEKFDFEKTLIIVGANGSGKTRLGVHLESLHTDKNKNAHRISAQKTLMMPNSSTPKSLDLAKADLFSGSENAIQKDNFVAYKEQSRWGQKPATFMLSDFDKLMVYLFSEHAEIASKFLHEAKINADRLEPPTTKLEKIKDIWEKILPHRELVIGGMKIETKIRDSANIYNASEMSDGERVIFYLIGQCLTPDENSYIIIDEPELHLHKSIQTSLWNEIQNERPSCKFIFITHDLEFASSMPEAKIIWLKAFDGAAWDFDEIQRGDDFPEALKLEILGSRKPILFVEGEKGSNESRLYQALFKDFLIIPSGSCNEVIRLVKGLRQNSQFIHAKIHGLIDRDRRTTKEVTNLLRDDVFCLKVAEVENLFCTKEIVEIVCDHQQKAKDHGFKSIKDFIFGELKKELENQISLHAAEEIAFQLKLFNTNVKNQVEVKSNFENLKSSIDTDEIWSSYKNEFDEIIDKKNYNKLLLRYNRKSLAKRIGDKIGLQNHDYPDLVCRLAEGIKNSEIRSALKPYFCEGAKAALFVETPVL